jgi:hypothetical protein
VRAGGRPERRTFGLEARLRWHAYWFEVNWQAQRRRLNTLALPSNPVFILGLWRSGTTVLHELLAESTGWLTPNTWQCFNPSTCFLTRPPTRSSSLPRPMDGGRIATLGPQEDEFALLLLGEPSAYRAFIDPRRLSECAEYLQTTSAMSLARWQDFQRGIAAEKAGTPVLLKSPGHLFRLQSLRQLFPGAKFVWIGRQTHEVLASNRKMWRALMERYALWQYDAGALEIFLGHALSHCASVLERCLEDMEPERMLWVDFERLKTEPRRVLGNILRFLDPGRFRDETVLSDAIERALAAVPIHAGSRASGADRPQRLDQTIAAARRRFGIV